jgi:hypothetical protein
MTLQLRTRPARLSVEALESRQAPAQLISASKLAYQDKDGDSVVVSFSKPILNFGAPNTIFTFDSGAGAVNGSLSTKELLKDIDLTSIPVAATGVGITITATRSAFNGGDGFAAVTKIDATGINLGAVAVDGDLGKILAGTGTPGTPGLKSLTAQSLGRYGISIASGSTHSIVQGSVGTLTIKGDVAGAFENTGGFPIGTIKVGGSLVGGQFVDTGVIVASGGIGKASIAGNIEGGTADATGQISTGDLGQAGAGIGTLTVGGSVIGGLQTGSAELVGAGAIVGNRIRSLTIGGSLIAGTDLTSGTFFANGAVLAIFDIGSITINGSVVGNRTSPAVISAGGAPTETGGKDLAIGSVTVRGRVEFGLIEAGVAPVTGSADQPVDADAQIGSVTVGGDWFASSIAAGSVAGAGGFGTAGDIKASGMSVRDEATVTSTIGSVTIAGQVAGTVAGGDHYGVVAENVGKIKIGGASVTLLSGNGNDDVVLGLTGDFDVREIQ